MCDKKQNSFNTLKKTDCGDFGVNVFVACSRSEAISSQNRAGVGPGLSN